MQENKITRNIYSNRIFRLIKETKLTAKDFAKSAGIAANSITDWKTGRAKPSVESLRKISKTYNVQLEWLTGDSRYRTKEEEFSILKQEGGTNERFNKN